MNKFRQYLDNDLSTPEIIEEKAKTTSTEVRLPFNAYANKTSDPDLQKDYAKRDMKGAIDTVRQEYKSKGRKLTLSAKFKKFTSDAAVFTVIVTG